ncbi:MAG: DUF2452 domain-containing protein [Pseudomonadota bacterium]
MNEPPDRERDKRKDTAADRRSPTLPTAPANPQGKGQVGFLVDWHYSTPRGVVAKSRHGILADYFTSLLVLSAAFKFKPVYGKPYYLYWRGERWELSLLAPGDWRDAGRQDAFAGTCVLHDDTTWSIDPSENLRRPGPVADAVASLYGGFVDKLASERPLEDELPWYEGSLPYYQRIFAAALSRSLKASLGKGTQLNLPSSSWLAELPRDAGRLLGHHGTD